MRPEVLAELSAVMRGDYGQKTAVTPATPVTGPSDYRSKPLELQALRPLQVNKGKLARGDSRTVTKPVPAVPEAVTAEILERAAILGEDRKLDADEVMDAVRGEAGFEHAYALPRAQIGAWHVEIDNLPLLSSKSEKGQNAILRIEELRVASLAFLDSDLAFEALGSGWDALALFSVFDGPLEAAMGRLGTRGLIPTLAWTSLGLTVEAVNSEHAVLRTRTGATQRQPRFPCEMEKSVRWWQMPLPAGVTAVGVWCGGF